MPSHQTAVGHATLSVAGARFTGWTNVKVCLALEQLAGTFELGITDRDPAYQEGYKFRPGSPCTVSLDGQTVITGYVDSFNPTYDKGSHGITVKGRDKTCDLVDCQHLGPPVQWNHAKLDKIALDACRPFGIPVAVETDLGAAWEKVKYDEGDTVHAFLCKWAKQRGVLLTSYGDGRLVITRSQQRGAGGSLVLGGNVESASGNFSNEGRFSKYIVKGQTMGTFWKGNDPEAVAEFQAAYTGPFGVADDGVLGKDRYRPMVIISEVKGTSAEFAERARFEGLVRAGKSRAASYTTTGWGPAAGQVWRINTVVQMSDAYMGLSGPYLIERCAYSLDSQGSKTEIGVIHPDAYNRRSEPATDEINRIYQRGMDQPT
jgi:prophage tail gpP-like protein